VNIIDVSDLRRELDIAEGKVENVHAILDRMHIPRDPRGYGRALTPYGRLALVQQMMPELWKHIQDEMDKYVKENL
jgi:hypothetical protein